MHLLLSIFHSVGGSANVALLMFWGLCGLLALVPFQLVASMYNANKTKDKYHITINYPQLYKQYRKDVRVSFILLILTTGIAFTLFA